MAYVKSDYASNSKEAMTTEGERKYSIIKLLLNHSELNKFSSSIRKMKQSGVTLITSYIPTTRSFLIGPLESNYTYVFQMTCVDNTGYRYISKQLFFTTGNYFSI